MRSTAVLCVVTGCAVSAQAQIRQWNTAIPSTKYDIIQPERRVIIKEGDTGIFKFEAYNGSTPVDIIEPRSYAQVRGVLGGFERAVSIIRRH